MFNNGVCLIHTALQSKKVVIAEAVSSPEVSDTANYCGFCLVRLLKIQFHHACQVCWNRALPTESAKICGVEIRRMIQQINESVYVSCY